MLQHAAFQSLFPYRPEVLMAQLSRRIDSTPPSKRYHIQEMNKIGREIPKLHERYRQFIHTDHSKRRRDPEEQAVAVLEVLRLVADLGARQHRYDLLTGERTRRRHNAAAR